MSTFFKVTPKADSRKQFAAVSPLLAERKMKIMMKKKMKRLAACFLSAQDTKWGMKEIGHRRHLCVFFT